MADAHASRGGAARLRPGLILGFAVGALATLCGVQGTQDAVANGDTRTIAIQHEHTKETATVTFKRNGYYDQNALKELNWLLRDWRLDEQTRMEPKLFDIVWEVYREVGSREPIRVVSAYRAPGTNAALRRRSRGVAEHSQHMSGKAMDFYLTDVPMSRVREVGMRLQAGGVGFYPSSYNPFVHLDAGSVRSWPRMTTDQLARLFPDGRTVHLPRDGKPLGGYEIAKADILARGGSVAGLTYAEAGSEGGERKSLWATLFGGSDDEDSDFYRSAASRTRAAPQRGQARVAYAETRSTVSDRDDSPLAFLTRERAAQAPAQEAAPAYPAQPEAAPIRATLEPQPARAPAPPTPPTPPSLPADARMLLEPVSVASVFPTPPPRPGEAPLLVNAPLPPSRPIVLAMAATGPAAAATVLQGQMRSPAPPGVAAAPADDRAALKSLFEAVATPAPLARAQFSSATPDDMRADRFRGSAVAPRAAIR